MTVRLLVRAGVMSALTAITATCAAAQDLGDAAKGKLYAERACAECHSIGTADTLSPAAKATPFRDIAARPEMTGTALAVWFRTPHPSMPNLIIPGEDKDNVIAYILSLSPRK